MRRDRSLTLEPLGVEDLLVLGAVLLLPWAFGGVEIWAYRAAAGLLVGAAALAFARGGAAELGLGQRSRWLWPAALLGVWALLQLLPLPAPAIRLLSPRAHGIYRETFPDYAGEALAVVPFVEARALQKVPEASGFAEPARALPPEPSAVRGPWSGWRTLSLWPGAGWERLHWYVALLLGFVLVLERTRDPEREHRYRLALFANFLALAVFGLVFSGSSGDRLYWVRATLDATQPFGPYVNPTNFAGAMELAVPWLGGAAAAALREGGGWRARRAAPILLAGAVLCLVAGVATASRSAALLLGGSATLIALLGAPRARARWVALLLAVALWGGSFLALRESRLGERVEEFFDATGSYSEVNRVVVWNAALRMFGDYSLAGCGFGAFRDVFPRYLPAGGFKRWNQLHNDWLEFAVEGGAIGVLLLVPLVLLFGRKLVRLAASRGPDGLQLEAIGLVLGLLLLSIHAVWDFNHQIPANALLYVTLAAIAVAKSERGGSVKPVRVVHVAGARPNFMKVAPVLSACARQPGLDNKLLHTGQHYDERMSRLFFEELGIPKPDIDLEVGSGSHAQQTAAVLQRLEPVLLEWRADLVVVVGDVNSTLAAALTASKLGIAVAHVEAGLRSFDRTMPEELNRILTDALSELLFVSEPAGVANLRREGAAAGSVHLVGNVMIDSLLLHRQRAQHSTVLERLDLAPGGYAVLTLHRPANVDDPATLSGMLAPILELARSLPVVFPVHPRARAAVDRALAGRAGGLRAIEPLGYLDFLRLMMDARLVLTDSGGIQEETTILGIPCLTLRDNTERPITLERGTNVLAGTSPPGIAAAIERALEQPPRAPGAPPLWDGHAGERIAAVIAAWAAERRAP